MKRRSIAWRVLVVAAGSGLAGSSIAFLVALSVTYETVTHDLGPVVSHRFTPSEAQVCETSPETYSLWFPGMGARGFAYDSATGLSRNRAAPPLRRKVFQRLDKAPNASALELRWFSNPTVIVFRTSAKAPCDIVQVLWVRSPFAGRLGMVVLVGGIVSAFFASMLGLLALVLPLTRRIHRLRMAAERVGGERDYPLLGQARDGDELDSLGAILDEAHARIRADARLLTEQREALERHLANVAHDLRTPLTSLQVSLEYAADSSHDPALREILAGALGDAVYLGALIANLRLASQLGAGWDPAAQMTEIDFSELVARVGGRGERLARRRRMELEVSLPDDPVRVTCNAVAAEQALGNVVDNAVGYGDPEGHVAIVLTLEGGGRRFRLEVRDDGPGVPPQEIPRLGERTFRSDEARQRDPRGHGLGLAITAEMCTRFGWTLRFAQLDPRGLLVTISGEAR